MKHFIIAIATCLRIGGTSQCFWRTFHSHFTTVSDSIRMIATWQKLYFKDYKRSRTLSYGKAYKSHDLGEQLTTPIIVIWFPLNTYAVRLSYHMPKSHYTTDIMPVWKNYWHLHNVLTVTSLSESNSLAQQIEIVLWIVFHM